MPSKRGRKPRPHGDVDDDERPRRGRGRGRGGARVEGARVEGRSSSSSNDVVPRHNLTAKKPPVFDENGNPIIKRRGRPPKRPEAIAAREEQDKRVLEALRNDIDAVKRNFKKDNETAADRLEDLLEKEVVQKEQEAARHGPIKGNKGSSSEDSKSASAGGSKSSSDSSSQ